MTFQTGNVDFIALNFRGRVYNVTPTQTRLIVGNGGLGFLSRSRFASNGLLHYRRSYTDVSFYFDPEWFGQINYDRSQQLTFRAVGGAGLEQHSLRVTGDNSEPGLQASLSTSA